MAKTYTWRFSVRSYELDASARVAPQTFLNYLEEGALGASGAAGYDMAWYRQNHRSWVIRKMTMRFYAPVTYPDELELTTWVSDFRRVQSNREYHLSRVSGDQAEDSGEPILRARGNWAFLDTESLQLIRVPQEFHEHFDPTGQHEEFDTDVLDAVTIEDPVLHTEERRVQQQELDSNGHVNNAVYLGWAEQALTNALRAVGFPPERLTGNDFEMFPHAAIIEYFRSALDNEPIFIVTRLAQIGRDRAAWQHEIRHGATNELIAAVTLVRAFTDALGARSIPDALGLALVRRAIG